MANLKEVKSRIKTVKNIGQITHAMELVSASKMRRAQTSALGSRHYSATMDAVIASLAVKNKEAKHPLLRRHKEGKTLLILIGPDKGLAGALVANLSKRLLAFVDKHGETDMVTFGRRPRDLALKLGFNVVAEFDNVEKPLLADALPASEIAISGFVSRSYSKVFVMLTHFVSTLVQKPVARQILPITEHIMLLDHGLTEGEELSLEDADYLMEPSSEAVLAALLPRFVQTKIYQSLLEALASEHSSRMIAMKNASDNAGELKDNLTLTYNQLRQASITREVAEISAGANI